MFKKILTLIFLVLVLTACSDKSIHKQITQQFEEAFVAEEEFIMYQEQLLELEEEDLEIYDEIIQLESTEDSEVNQLIVKALQIIEQRSAYLDAERTAIKQSKEYFVESKPLIALINDQETKELLEKMYDTMLKRYESYDGVYESYVTSLTLSTSLYEHLEANSSPTLIHNTIEDINESYENLFYLNDQFNRLTKDYNRLKREYYELIWES